MNGYGNWNFNEGSQYSAKYVDGKLDGKLALKSASKSVFHINYSNGFKEGKSILEHVDGSKYNLEFKNDQANFLSNKIVVQVPDQNFQIS